MRKALILICSIAILYSCNGVNREGEVIRLDLTKSLTVNIPASGELASALSDVTFTELQGVIFRRPRFFYADNKKYGLYDDTRILFIDAETGDVLSEFDRSGRGPQEYVRATKVSFQNSTVCVSDGNTNRAQFYTMDGEYLYTKELPERCDRTFFDTDGYALVYPNYTGRRFELFRGEEKVNEFTCEKDITGNPITCFGTINKFNDDYFFCSELTDTLYRVTYDKIEPYLFFDKGSYSLPLDSRGKLDAGDGCIMGDFIIIAGDLGFVNFHYKLPRREIWNIAGQKIIFKTAFAEDNLDPGFPVMYGDKEFEFWPIYCSGDYIFDILQEEETTAIISVKVQNIQH